MLRNRRLIKGLLLVLVGLVAREYAHFTYFTSEMARNIVYSLYERPYVYRAMVPWIAYVLTGLGVSPEIALTIVVICTAIGFLYALNYLFHSFDRS